MNQLTIIGNLTRDPETRTTNGGKSVCNFDVAVSKRVNGEENTTYFRVAAWGTLGDNCAKYLAKGRKVCVVGEVSCRGYAGKDGTPKASLDVFATNVEFLTPRGEQQPEPTPAAVASGAATPSILDGATVIDEDLPF